MRYVSLFSGVEAATVAWSRLGWEPLAFAEVDEFASAVLAHRFPQVPNLGDVREIDWSDFHERHGAVDVLVGGSPCQSFSIAGSRAGLRGESRLMFEYVRAVRDLVRASGGRSPRYIVWENVPGCLSSNGGRDFGCLLDELEDCGYFVAWRTLDAQFARVPDGDAGGFRGPVPQRRRRVFLVGSLGGVGSCEILFERTCLSGDHPKGAGAREALAEPPAGGAGGGCCAGGVGCEDSLTPWDAQSKRVYSPHGAAPTLCSGERAGQSQVAVAFEQNQRGEVRLNGGDGSVAGALSSNPAQTKGQGASLVMTQYGEVAGTLVARGDSSPCADRGQNVVCMADDNAKASGEGSLNHQNPVPEGGGSRYVVRRLMPVEYERLMGFPDGWTDLAGCDADAVTERVAAALKREPGGKEHRALRRKVGKWSKETPDAPRYKAMGNSIVTLCLEVIGRRIAAYDELHYDEAGLGWGDA